MLTPGDWERLLSAELDWEVRVLYGHARRCTLRAHDLCSAPRSLRRPPGRGVLVRMNAFFAGAPPDVQTAVADWLRSGRRARRASARLDEFIHAEVARLEADEPRPLRAQLRGQYHDLAPIVRRLLETVFASELGDSPPTVTWGRRQRSNSRHSLQLGVYDYARRVVRIHPVLDQPAVPEWFVTYVVFHELLHAALHGAGVDAGRHHGPTFRAREEAWPDYRRAVLWERAHLPALIRSARAGRAAAAGDGGPRRGLARARTAALIRGVQGFLFPD